jgi:iron complex outermembrane receptor protein
MRFGHDAVHITTGVKLEHNNLSGFAFQPNVRILWKVRRGHAVWAAFSRAYRTASPSDTALQLNLVAFPGPNGLQVLRTVGNTHIASERLNAFEAGYRFQPHRSVSLESAIFYNRYADLVGSELGTPFFEPGPPPRLVLPLVGQNNISGNTFGGELTAKWIPSHSIHFAASYSYIQMDLVQSASAFGGTAKQLEGQPPRHQARLNSSIRFFRNLELSNMLSFVDRRTYSNVPGYVQLDGTLVWRPFEKADFMIGAQNLLNKQHVEFDFSQGTFPTAFTRSVFGKFTWHF